MDFIDLILLGVIIGSNNLAVSFALGALKTKKYHSRIIIVFGIFEFFIPLIGLLIGRYFTSIIDDYAYIVGTIVLISLGLITIGSSFIKRDNTLKLSQQITSYKGIISLAMGLSLDNLIVGFSMGLRNVEPFLLAGVIATFSVVFAFVGLKTGKYLSKNFQTITKISAGILLVLLGFATYFGWI
ncbi:MAG: manganese efflux pump [Brumimicrobium sp.]